MATDGEAAGCSPITSCGFVTLVLGFDLPFRGEGVVGLWLGLGLELVTALELSLEIEWVILGLGLGLGIGG